MAEPGWRWAIVCGLALGLGFETKYAMAYFFLGAGIAAFVSPEARKLVLSARGAAILALGLLLLLPNVLWNAAHGFPTVAHTGHNADWNHARYSLGSVLAFLGGQFGVFGPVMMAGLLLALVKLVIPGEPSRDPGPIEPPSRWVPARASLGRDDNPELILAGFSLPVLLLITVQSFISEANANWAAVAYVAATPLAVAALLWLWQGRALWASVAFDSLAMVMLWIIAVSPAFADRIGQGNAFKRQEGWRELASEVVRHAPGHDVIVGANRSVFAELLYYARADTVPMRMWDRDRHDDDHFQMTMRLMPPAHDALLVLEPDETRDVLPTFDSSTTIATVTIPVGGHRTRTTLLIDAHDYRGPSSPR